jgi:hypothetical protein
MVRSLDITNETDRRALEVEDAKKKYEQNGVEAQFAHVFEKTNFLHEFSNGVSILGRPSLAKQLRSVRRLSPASIAGA